MNHLLQQCLVNLSYSQVNQGQLEMSTGNYILLRITTDPLPSSAQHILDPLGRPRKNQGKLQTHLQIILALERTTDSPLEPLPPSSPQFILDARDIQGALHKPSPPKSPIMSKIEYQTVKYNGILTLHTTQKQSGAREGREREGKGEGRWCHVEKCCWSAEGPGTCRNIS